MVRLASFNPAVPAAKDGRRRALLAKVHMAPKALGMLEEDYRHLLHRITGKSSAKDCNLGQLDDVVREFERLGFKSSAAAPRPRKARADHPVAAKARALWVSLHHLDAIDDPSEDALETFGKRQLGVDRLQWADQSEGYRLIEALKAMAERHGWSQAVPSR
ncbi:regulatory protein GemA, partial [Salmonella enterica]|nr:regulatory protein GemA [Salmonella enterica]